MGSFILYHVLMSYKFNIKFSIFINILLKPTSFRLHLNTNKQTKTKKLIFKKIKTDVFRIVIEIIGYTAYFNNEINFKVDK